MRGEGRSSHAGACALLFLDGLISKETVCQRCALWLLSECRRHKHDGVQGKDGKDLPAAVLLSFVQRYADPDVMP